MKASKFSDAQKAFIIKQGDDGLPVAEICETRAVWLTCAGVPAVHLQLACAYHLERCSYEQCPTDSLRPKPKCFCQEWRQSVFESPASVSDASFCDA